jgi:hypothetical protein
MPEAGRRDRDETRLVYRTAVASLVVQLVIFGVTSVTFFVPMPKDDRVDIEPIVALELSSQLVETLWYTTVVCRYRSILTWTRYLDWVVSTPMMILSTVLFFFHRRDRAVWDVLREPVLYATLALNWGMLLFGFLVERGALEPACGLPLGSLCFVASFLLMRHLLDGGDGPSVGLYAIMFAVWALYGVAATLSEVKKNVMYNGLDIVSKNFYGLFLLVYSLTLRESAPTPASSP